jgi:hypothetical protein
MSEPLDDQVRSDALLEEGGADIAETLALFAAGSEAYSAASVEVWEPPTRVSNSTS